MTTIEINDRLLSKNDQYALANRRTFDRHGVWCVNLISAPGSGKTTLIEKTVDRLAGELYIAVLVGDLETQNDADRIAGHGVPVRQIITGGTCHLTARVIGEFLAHFDLPSLDVLIIENVGNLVCPASYYLGEHDRVCLVSTPEGDDKPLKYPAAIHTSNALLITKTDLLPYTDFDLEKVRQNALRIESSIEIMALSCRSGEGMEQWYGWFESHARLQTKKQDAAGS